MVNLDCSYTLSAGTTPAAVTPRVENIQRTPRIVHR